MVHLVELTINPPLFFRPTWSLQNSKVVLRSRGRPGSPAPPHKSPLVMDRGTTIIFAVPCRAATFDCRFTLHLQVFIGEIRCPCSWRYQITLETRATTRRIRKDEGRVKSWPPCSGELGATYMEPLVSGELSVSFPGHLLS